MARLPWRIPRPPMADSDPFYRDPPDLAGAPPGQILRVRSVTVAWFGLVSQPIAAWQLLYRTTDVHGEPEAAVTTVLIPPGRHAGKLVSYQCAIDAVSPRALPSYNLRRRARVAGAVPPFELSFMASATRRGWVVTIPDHTGKRGRFGAPHEPGFRTLDAIRATLAFSMTGLDSQSPVAMLGYSGGGMATSWAVEMASSYAPELPIVGAVLGSPVGDPAMAFRRLNKTFAAGLPALVVAAMRGVYPEVAELINSNTTARGKRKLALAERTSTIGAIVLFAFNDFDHYVKQPLDELLDEPVLQKLFADLQLGTNKPSCPVLVVQSVHDRIVSIDDVDAQVVRYREHGAHVRYVRDRLSEHIILMPLAVPTMLTWVADRFDGKPLGGNTTQTVWTMATGNGPGLREMVANNLRMMFGRKLTRRR